jgi:hypothetical protein
MKKIFILLIFNLSVINAQQIKPIKDINYLTHNYSTLDKDFNIKINTNDFNRTVEKYKFIRERINTYRDSLGVVLMYEFGDWTKARKGELRITYSWKRVGYHIWENEEYVKKLAKRQNINLPYELQKMFYNPDNNLELISIIKNLRNKLCLKFKSDTLKVINNKNLMKFAFNNNPDVFQLRKEIIHKKNIEKFKKKHNRLPNLLEKEKLGLSCGKENCCQLKN